MKILQRRYWCQSADTDADAEIFPDDQKYNRTSWKHDISQIDMFLCLIKNT